MKPEELRAIGERAAAATPGPWWAEGGGVYAPIESDSVHVIVSAFGGGPGRRNCEFVAHARVDIPLLLAHVRDMEMVAADSASTVVSLEAQVREQDAEIGAWFDNDQAMGRMMAEDGETIEQAFAMVVRLTAERDEAKTKAHSLALAAIPAYAALPDMNEARRLFEAISNVLLSPISEKEMPRIRAHAEALIERLEAESKR